MQKLAEKIEKYKGSLNLIESKREAWDQVSRALIMDVLNRIKGQYQLDWYVQDNQMRKNSESVSLCFENKPSGIIESDNKGAKSFMETGGKLSFQQCHNGDILITLTYPFIEEIAYPLQEHKLLKQISPGNLNESLIVELVSLFLDEIIFWHTCVDRPIGFTPNKENGR